MMMKFLCFVARTLHFDLFLAKFQAQSTKLVF